MGLENETQLSVHFDSESCHCGRYQPTRSISDSQRREIEHCVAEELPHTKETMEEIWQHIWVILFPGCRSPETPCKIPCTQVRDPS